MFELRNIFKTLAFVSLLALTCSCFNNRDKKPSFFKDVKFVCDRDGGKMWGVNLYSPTIIVDHSHSARGNVPYAPKSIADTIPVCNSLVTVDDITWVMLEFPMIGDWEQKLTGAVKQMFYYHQPSLGLQPSVVPDNSHLLNRDARTLMKLEWNALVLAADDKLDLLRKQKITDALIFREMRHKLYPDHSADEVVEEIGHGLAAYTGMKFVHRNEKKYLKSLKNQVGQMMEVEDLPSRFSDISAPLYGFLLDQAKVEWREAADVDSDLSVLLSRVYKVEIPQTELEANCERIKNKYGFGDIDVVEARREILAREKSKALEHDRVDSTSTVEPLAAR